MRCHLSHPQSSRELAVSALLTDEIGVRLTAESAPWRLATSGPNPPHPARRPQGTRNHCALRRHAMTNGRWPRARREGDSHRYERHARRVPALFNTFFNLSRLHRATTQYSPGTRGFAARGSRLIRGQALLRVWVCSLLAWCGCCPGGSGDTTGSRTLGVRVFVTPAPASSNDMLEPRSRVDAERNLTAVSSDHCLTQ